ncbi:MAG: ABC transporter permease subunit [Alphaproteobacteria bacterium]|nr:ABC transporter permease subunit [Alphaproteobacteria bacterium]
MRKSHSWTALVWQVLLLLSLAAVLAWLSHNTWINMRARGIQSGFDYLLDPAGFDIAETALGYSAESPFWLAFLVGLVNTLWVAIPGMIGATLLGLLLAVGRISSHPLARALCAACIETLRNVPLLIQLFTWYVLMIEFMPEAGEPWRWGDALMWSKAGFSLDVWGMSGYLSPEYLALLLGLILYTAAFIAEVFRAGIEAVPRAQTLAAQSLGLSVGQSLRWVVLPQAMRVSLPPLTSQYLNLTKNSSLAVAIGYPDLVSIANTALNQTGRAVECIAIIMMIYLSVSLLTAWIMNRYNQRVNRHAH